MKAYKGSSGIVPLILTFVKGGSGQIHAPATLPQERMKLPIK